MTILRKSTSLVIGAFFGLSVFGCLFLLLRAPQVHAFCSADLQSTISTSSFSQQIVIGKEFTFQVDITNIGSNGYGPFIDLLFPAGTDEDDGIDFMSATLQGLPLSTSQQIGIQSGTLDHSFLVDVTGSPVPVAILTGQKLISITLPFGSFVTNQSISLEIKAVLNENADINDLLDIQTRGGFSLGCDALDNYSTDIPVVSSGRDTQQINPVVFSVAKYHPASNSPVHAVIGPYHERTYILRIDVGSGQILSGVTVSDYLPSNMVYAGLVSVSYPGYTLVHEPIQDNFPHESPDNLLQITLPVITGTDQNNDLQIVYSYYTADFSTTGAETILSGVSSTTTNEVEVTATRTPRDVRDPQDIFVVTDDHTMINDVMVLRKDTLTFVSGGGFPGGVVEYPLEFDLSDYHQTSGLVLVDTLQDGLRFDETFQPYIEIVDSEGSYSGLLLSGTHYTIDNSDIGNDTNTATSGSQTMTIYISQFMKDAGYDELLQGGEIASTTGIAAGGRIVLRAVILDAFTDSYLPGNESVDVGDYLTNTATLYRTNLSPSLSIINTGFFTQSLSFNIQGSSLTKTIYAINGSTGFSAPITVSPGDTVTYRVVYSIPSSDAEEITIVDYLPLPVFSVDGFLGFSGGIIGTIPPVGWGTYGVSDTLHTLTGLYLFPGTGSVTPVFSTNISENTLTLAYPAFNDNENRASVIDILFTVEVTPEPFADNFNITNMVTVGHKTTNASVTSLGELVQIVLKQPDLILTKGVVESSDAFAAFLPSVPVVTSDVCPRITTPVNSSFLDATPLQSSLVGVEGIQRVTYALVVENKGGAQKGAFDIVVKDTMPEGFVIPASGMNLCIQNGAGDMIAYEAIGSGGVVDTDLFGTGLQVVDPLIGSGIGGIEGYSATGGKNIIIITYDLETTNALIASGVYVNTGTLLNFSSIEGGPNFISETITEIADVTLVAPLLSKSLESTSLPETSGARIVPGEEAIFKLLLDVPDSSSLSGLVISDVLPAGLELLHIDSLTFSGSLELVTGNSLTGILASAAYLPISGGFSLDFGLLLNSDSTLETVEQVEILYTARVSNQYGGVTNSSLVNTSTVSWYAQDVLFSIEDTETLTYSIPSLLIQKSGTTANSSSERFASYTLLIQNTSLVPAFDVDLIDELDSKGLEFVSGSLTVLGVTGTIVEQGPDLAITYGSLLPGEFSQVSFQTKVMTGVAYNTGIVNVVTGTWSTLAGSFSEERSYTGSASLTTTFSFSPSITKTLQSTDQSVTAGTNVAVGETMVFYVAVEIPEETQFSGFRITDQLDSGLKIISVDLLQSSGMITSSLGTISTGVIIPAITSSDTLLTLDFGTIYNSDTNLLDKEYIILEYTVLVDDAVVNTNGLTRRNRARANRYTSPSMQSNVEQRRSVVIREPLLSLQKSAPSTNTDSDRTIAYTIQISNQTANVLTASNLSLTDLLPIDMSFISGTQLSGPTPDTLTFGTSTLIAYTEFPLGQTGVFEITARLDSSITANTSRINQATGSWTSLPGSVSGERTTVATDDATTNFTFALVPNKLLIGSDYGQTSGTQVTVGEQLQYEVIVEVPEDSTFTGVLLIDQLDTGLSWIELNSLTASGTLTSSVGFGSVVPIVSGQQLTFDFGTIANSDLNTSDIEFIVLKYSVLVDDLPSNIASTNLDNIVQASWVGGSAVIGGPTVTVVEPAVTITKSGPVSNGGELRTINYTVTVTNQSLLDVYNVVWDDVFTGTNLTLLDVAFSSGVIPTLISTGGGNLSVSYATLSGGLSSSVLLTARLNDDVITPVNTLNTVDASWNNLLTGGRTYTGSDQLQTSFSTLPTLYHTVIATDQPQTTGTGVAVVGEVITYETRIRIPNDSVIHSGSVYQLLATGYTFVDGSLLVSASTGVTCLPINCGAVSVVSGAQYLDLNFGTITNSETNTGVDHFITVSYQVLVTDIPSVSAATQLSTTATLYRSDNPSGTSQAVAVTVVEPSLDIQKSGPVSNTNSAREIAYTITIQNDGSVDAFTVSGYDDVGAIGLDLLSVEHTSGPVPTINVVGNVFTYSLPTLAVGEVTTLSLSARLQDAIPTAYIATNTAPLSWTSLSGGSGRLSTGEDSVATSFNTVGSLTKEVITTSESSTLAGNIAFGEVVTYRVQIEIPADSVYHAVSIEDTLGTGLAYVSSSSIITTSGSVTCSPSCLSVSPTVVGSNLSYPYVSVSNTATGAGMTGTITIEYQAILTDDEALSNGSMTANSAVFIYSDQPGGTSPVSLPFTVVEPTIDLLVSGPVMNTSGARTITYSIQITNNSDAPAYSLQLTDVLSGVGLDFVSASYVAGIAPTSIGSSDPFVVTYASLLPGATSELSLTVRLRDTVPTPTTITHTMTGTYASDLSNTRTYVSVDSASTLYTTPYTLSKIITASSLTSTITPQVTLGEEVVYTLQVDVEPDSALNNIVFVDTLPTGMSFVSGNVVPDIGVTCVPTCGGAAFTTSGQDVLISFDTLANTALSSRQLFVDLTLRIDDISELYQGVSLINGVALRTSDNTGGVLASAIPITVVEPTLRITKDVSNTTGSRTALYQVTIDHLPSSMSDAYDISLEDPLFDLGFTYVSGSFTVLTGVVPATTVTTTGIIWTYDQLSPLETSTIQFAARLDNTISTSYAKINILSGNWSSIPEGGRVYSGNDDATISLSSPTTIQHFFVDTDQAESLGTGVAIGEEVTYAVTLTIPDDGALTDAVLTLELETGFSFIGFNGLSFSPTVTSSLGGTGSINYVLSGSQVIIDFGTLSNSDTNVLSSETVVLNYIVRVTDISGVGAGQDLSVLGILDRSDGQMSVGSPEVHILEATLFIDKQAPVTNSASSRTISYTVDIRHDTGSTYDAYDVLFEDDLAAEGMEYVTGSLVVSGTQPTLMGTNPLQLGWDTLVNNELVSLTFSARLHDSVATPITVGNIGSVSRTSLSGTSVYERTSPTYFATDQADTLFSTEGTQFKELLTTTLEDTVDPFVTIGEELVYRVAVKIPENAALNDLIIEDILPAEVTYIGPEGISAPVSVTSSFGLLSGLSPVYTPGTHTLRRSLGTVSNSDSVSGTNEYIYAAYRVRVDDEIGVVDGTSIENSASAEWSDGSVSGSSVWSEVVEPMVGFTKSAMNTNYDDQHQLVYTIAIDHLSGSRASAYSLRLDDDLAGGILTTTPQQVSVLSGEVPSSITLSGTYLVVSYDSLSLNSGSTLQVITTLDTSVSGDQLVTNTLTGVWESTPSVLGFGRSGSSENGAYSVTTQESVSLNFIDLSLSSSISDTTSSPNSPVTYTIVVTNTGVTTAHDIQILNILPLSSGLTLLSNLPSIGTYEELSGIWEISSLLPGESVTLNLVITSSTAKVYTLLSEIVSTREPDRDSYPDNRVSYEDDITTKLFQFANSGLASSPSVGGGGGGGGGGDGDIVVSPPVTSFDELINLPGVENKKADLPSQDIILSVFDQKREDALPDERKMCIGSFDVCPYVDGRFTTYEFSDVLPINNFASGVSLLLQHCVIHGNGDSAEEGTFGTFAPYRTITRGESLKMIARSLKMPADELGDHLLTKRLTAHRATLYAQSLHTRGILIEEPNLDELISQRDFFIVLVRGLQRWGLVDKNIDIKKMLPLGKFAKPMRRADAARLLGVILAKIETTPPENVGVEVCKETISDSGCMYTDGSFSSYHFIDLGNDRTLQESINLLTDHCIIHGAGDSAQMSTQGFFRPGEPLLYGEAYKMIARAFGIPEVGDHFTLKKDISHWAHGYETSLLLRGTIAYRVRDLDGPISYQDFVRLLGLDLPDQDTLYEFTRGDAAKILAEYLKN